MRILVTRPREDAAPLARLLESRGHQVVIESLLDIQYREAEVDLAGVQALLFTSANGVRAYLHSQTRRDFPVYAVGDATARAARSAGFAHVESAHGDVDTLAALAQERLKPEAGALMHVAGSQVAGDLSGQLEKAGFSVRRAVLYEAHAANHLSDATAQALRDGHIDGVMFFSPRTATAFATLAGKQDLTRHLNKVSALCLSPAVAGKVNAAAWRRVRTAKRPDQDALLAEVAKEAAEGEVTQTQSRTHDEQASDAAGAEQKPAPKRGALYIGLGALIVAGLAGFVAFDAGLLPFDRADNLAVPTSEPTRHESAKAENITPDSSEVALLRVEMERQRVKIAELEKALSGRPEITQAESERIQALEARLAAAESRGPDATALGERLASLEKNLAEATAKREAPQAMMLAVAQLRQRADSGLPFAVEWKTLTTLLGNDPALADARALVASRAGTGAPTLLQLRERFGASASHAARAALAPEGADIWSRTLQNLSSLVTLRRTDAPAGDMSAQAQLARSEALLKSGDLAGAVAALDALTGAAADAMANWRNDAKARVALDRGLSELTASALARAGG